MMDDSMTLASLRSYLDTLPDAAHDRVLRTALGRIESTPQRRRSFSWFPLSPLAFAGAATTVLVIGVVMGVLLGGRPGDPVPAASTPPVSASGSGASPLASQSPLVSPSPGDSGTTISIDEFAVPFRVETPLDLVVGRADASVVVLLAPLAPAVPKEPLPSPWVDFYQPGHNEIIVVAADGAHADGCWGPPRMLRFKAGDDVLGLLASEAGFRIETTPTILDGRPAVIASFIAQCYDHLHMADDWTLSLSRPRTRTFVVTVDETTVFIQIWSDATAGTDEWTSVAEDIVQSIDFAGL